MIEHYEYMLKNFKNYNSGLNKNEFIELLNILEYNGENYDSFYNAIFNCYTEFCGIYHNGGYWESQKDLYNTLIEFHRFIKPAEIKEVLTDKMMDILDDSMSFNDVHEYFNDFINELNQTTDGYIIRYDY